MFTFFRTQQAVKPNSQRRWDGNPFKVYQLGTSSNKNKRQKNPRRPNYNNKNKNNNNKKQIQSFLDTLPKSAAATVTTTRPKPDQSVDNPMIKGDFDRALEYFGPSDYRYRKITDTTHPDYLLWSSCITVDLISYENRTTDKREQYD